MGTALWLIWQVAHLLGLPMAVGYLFGRWTQRKEYEREHADHEDRDHVR